MSDILDRIDAATAGLCPCGAEPRDGSAYCSYDCEPTHVSEHTEAPNCETAWPGLDYDDPRYAPPTPMRWRPDLVSTADDTDLIPLGSQTHGYAGRFNAQVYERASDPTTWHLRLDDGNLFVGCDLRDVGGRQDPISIELVGRVREAWQRLERKLTDTRDKVRADDDDPWADVIVDPARELLEVSRARRRYFGAQMPAWLGAPEEQPSQVRRSYHNQVVRAVDVPAADLSDFARMASQSMRPLVAAADAFLRDVGRPLAAWQRQMLEQMGRVQSAQPRRFGLSARMETQLRVAGFRPLVNAREAAMLAESGLREGVDFLRYPSVPPLDEPPADPMLRAIEAKRNRNTGPPKDRLDGRSRR